MLQLQEWWLLCWCNPEVFEKQESNFYTPETFIISAASEIRMLGHEPCISTTSKVLTNWKLENNCGKLMILFQF